MRVEIQALPGGGFKAIGFGWAGAGRDFPMREVVDVELHVLPRKGGGSKFVMTGHLSTGGKNNKGTADMSPKDLVESYKKWFDRK